MVHPEFTDAAAGLSDDSGWLTFNVFFLTCPRKPFNLLPVDQVLLWSLIGNFVKVEDRPAAVIGDETRSYHCSEDGMGRREV